MGKERGAAGRERAETAGGRGEARGVEMARGAWGAGEAARAA